MELRDMILLLHPTIAVLVVFPLLGIVMNKAWQTRERRLQSLVGGKSAGKSKIPPTVGQEHVRIGQWLTGSVVGIVLLALANDVFGHIVDKQLWSTQPFHVMLLGVIFGVAIVALGLLYRAKERLWRAMFATLSGASIVILGCQDGVYRKTSQWYFSHYYYGIAAALLMIFSLAILREIYQDRTNRWRNTHIILNCIALVIFLGQGFTGTQSLLEVPLTWQEPYVNQLYKNKCSRQACTIQVSPAPAMSP